jgi:hypothetical protein
MNQQHCQKDYLLNLTSLQVEEPHTALTNCDIPAKSPQSGQVNFPDINRYQTMFRIFIELYYCIKPYPFIELLHNRWEDRAERNYLQVGSGRSSLHRQELQKCFCLQQYPVDASIGRCTQQWTPKFFWDTTYHWLTSRFTLNHLRSSPQDVKPSFRNLSMLGDACKLDSSLSGKVYLTRELVDQQDPSLTASFPLQLLESGNNLSRKWSCNLTSWLRLTIPT